MIVAPCVVKVLSVHEAEERGSCLGGQSARSVSICPRETWVLLEMMTGLLPVASAQRSWWVWGRTGLLWPRAVVGAAGPSSFLPLTGGAHAPEKQAAAARVVLPRPPAALCQGPLCPRVLKVEGT